MRIAALVLGVLGGLAAAMLSIKWLGDAAQAKESIEAVRAMGGSMGELDSLVRAAYCLLGSFVLGIAGGVFSLKGKGKLASALLLAGAVVPAIFAAQTLIATFFLVIAAPLAFFAKPKQPVAFAQPARA